MLTAGTDAPPALRDVLAGCLAAVEGEPNALGLPRMRSAAVVVVDGLGAAALAARAGHARTLAGRAAEGAPLVSGFPTTTAAALTSLTTGTDPGEHGIVGYSALEPESGAVVNQLRGFDGELPAGWQRSPTLFERARSSGVRPIAVGPRHYAASGFTGAVLRGADYLGARTMEARFEALADAFRRGRSIGYLYVPELDVAAHAEGWRSTRWTAELETFESALAAGLQMLRGDVGIVVTADHGMVDVDRDDHVLYDTLPGLLDPVRAVAGEPRCLQLHLLPGADATAVAAEWSGALGGAATVVTRAKAVDRSWFGRVHPAVLPRIGDVLVAARGSIALYDSRNERGRGMVGQHGSWEDEERLVPLARFGAAG
jgi:hypothetical protein